MSAPLKFELDRRQGVINIGYGAGSSPSFTNLTVTSTLTVGGSVHGANGTAANPSFAFLSDQNTGLYRIGVNNIGVAANGAKVLDIATTGLTVTGALGASSLTSPAATNLTLGTGTSGAAITVLSASNNVGIGTTAPQTGAKLHVKDANSGASLPTNNGILLEVASSSNGGIGIAGNAATLGYYFHNASGSYDSGVETATASRNLVLRTAGATRVTVASNGDTTLASSTAGSAGAGALVVTGGLATGAASYIGGDLTVSGSDKNINISSTAESPALLWTATGGNAANRSWRAVINNSENGDWGLYQSATAGGAANTKRFSFNQSGAATFAGAVTSTGTLNANSAGSNVSLAASGTTVQSGIIVQANTGFVFFADYATVTKGIKVDVNNGGLTILSGALTTATPTGGTAKPWKVGEAATVSPTSPNRTIRVEIDGTVYYLAAKTTND